MESRNERIQSSNQKQILITGASSGIGYQAALTMLKLGHRLIIPCRSEKKIESTLYQLEKDCNASFDLDNKVKCYILDLSDIDSVSYFGEQLSKLKISIDTLILNAGLQYTGSEKPRFSSQGFELTFAVNHLSHQYLSQLILPLLFKSKSPRIVVTASEVHNPNTPGGRIGTPADLGKLDGIKTNNSFVMLDGSTDFNADKAYKDSKLCNLLFAQEIFNRLKLSKRPMPVIAWAPGLVIPRSKEGFFRYSRTYNEIGQRLFSLIARDILKITETPENAGRLLAMLATNDKYDKVCFSYYSNQVSGLGKRKFDISDISDQASDMNLSKSLWEATEKLYM